MRNVLITLLICFFAGVTTAAAYTHVPRSIRALERSMAVETDLAAKTVQFTAHHAQCCQPDSQTGKTTKPFGCGPDCLSHFSVVALQFQSAVTGPETTSPPVLTDALPSAEDQPPIKG
ncbi:MULTISPECIES: hypothetical protein [Stappiaceae]|jgi:hypothetical protein|uniref:hypothetical protein n=1 Tax=Stappiaceae TaxID=2821832 RepID=UPI001AD9EFE6|nr:MULTISPECIES: hypothetical protein [Stappiaceae]MBO9459423.1 hypothetical protein [Labrenzia sp. R5_0]MEE2864046.1 hypothetical protein [Pseudomonadota bacterium]UES39782.1 hypothetical protein GFC08_19065 [Roseibium aggregatum]UES50364.1 hypothetical protein GFK88_12495 [Roseibium aggregatum]